jgi:hypothetical protein
MSPLAERTGGRDAMRRETARQEYVSFASLAKTERRLSWAARHRAAEAEEAANLDNYRHFAREAKRLWRNAWWHLRVAHERKALWLNG